MAETADDLSAPLGQNTARAKRRFRLPFTGMQALAVLLGLLLVTFAGFALFNSNPLGGEPIVRIALPQATPGEKSASAAPAISEPMARSATKQAAIGEQKAGEQKTVTIIDGSSGKHQEVPIGGAVDGPDKAETAAPAMMAGIDPQAAGKIPLRHDPGDRRRPEAVHGLRGRGRSRQGRQDAGRRHRGRRPRRRRGQDHRRHHETAARGDPGVHALRFGSRPSSRNGRGRSITRSCCRFRWSRSTIPTTIPARRPC